MNRYRILYIAIVAAACLATGASLRPPALHADNEPAAPAAVAPGRFVQLQPHKDAASDDVQILDTVTGKLYSLQKRAKPKEKEPAYEWVLVAEGPK